MKKKINRLKKVLMSFIALMLISSSIFSQVKENNAFNIKFQLGASNAFGLSSDSSVIIPQFGFDFNFGKFGLRTTAQFFKTSPEFDIDSYLAPIDQHISQSSIKKNNSNFLIGISPHLNFQFKSISIQPAFGIKYLKQNGATRIVKYIADPQISITKFPINDVKRSSIILEPNIRAVFGKPNKSIRFYAEAAYSLAMGTNEYSFSTRNLSGVVLPDGSIDGDMMEMAPTITRTEKIISDFFYIGIGLELNLTNNKKLKVKTGDDFSKTNTTDINIPDEELNRIEISPLVVHAKGSKKNKQGDVITFSWETLNNKDCEHEMIVLFEIIEKENSKKGDKVAIKEKKIFNNYLKPKEIQKSGQTYSFSLSKNKMPSLFEQDKEFEWQVSLLDKNHNKPQCAWGGNNTAKNTYKSNYGCDFILRIDSVNCNTSHSENGFNFYDVYISVENPDNPNCDNPNVKIDPSSLFINPPSSILNSNIIGNPTIIQEGSSPYIPGGTLLIKTQQSLTSIDLYLFPISVHGITTYASTNDSTDLPQCACNFCDDVEITISDPIELPQTVEHSNYEAVSFPVLLNYTGPLPVNRIVAEVIAFEHVFDNKCIICNTDNHMHGVFVDDSKNKITANPNNWIFNGNATFYPTANNFSREASWNTSHPDGTFINGLPLNLNLGLPIRNKLSCCGDRVKFTIRYSFFSIELETNTCRVCEITKTYCISRKGNNKPKNPDCREAINPSNKLPSDNLDIKTK